MAALQTYRIATININTIRARHKLTLLHDMIYAADVDIVLLQEVHVAAFYAPRGFIVYVSHASPTGSGVAILLRDGIHADDVVYLPDARGMALTFGGVRIINVYAPSGSGRRRERSTFFSEGVTPLFLGRQDALIMGGDFNCTQAPKDQLPRHSPCAALATIVQNLNLVDSWEHVHGNRPGFTHFTSHSSSRLDRVYISRDIVGGMQDAEIWPAAFSNHDAYICAVNLSRQKVWRSRGLWKLNTYHLTSPNIQQQIETTWTGCLQRRNTYQSALSWWVLCAKPTLRKTLISYGREAAAWRRRTQEFYFTILRECTTMPFSPERQMIVNRAKAQLTALSRRHLEGAMVRARRQDTLAKERPTMYHVIAERRHRRRNLIDFLTSDDGRRLDTQSDIGSALHAHYSTLYSAQRLNPNNIAEVSRLTFGLVPEDAQMEMLADVTEDEVNDAIQAGSPNKSPGPDGIPLEFYRQFRHLLVPVWTEICRDLMSPHVQIPEAFLEGIIIPIPKHRVTSRICDYRPLTLLNSDTKIFTRLLAARLKRTARYVVSPDQTSLGGVNNIRTALCRYRDIISLAHSRRMPGILAALDFSQAFDRVDHDYLEAVLCNMGYHETTVNIIMRLLRGATSRVLYNGRLSPSILIRRSVRQGCPLSALLYAFAMEPLLCGLRQRLTGISLGGHVFCCTTYADDLVLVLRSGEEVRDSLTWVTNYGEASGSCLNIQKSSALPIGVGLPEENVAPLRVTTTIRCLGLEFTGDMRRTIALNCRRLLTQLRAGLLDHRLRALDLLQRTQYVNVYLASRIPHVAQTFPIPPSMAHRMLAALGSYVCHGHLFKIRYETLTLPRNRGGLGLYHVPDRVTALFISSQMVLWRRSPTCLTSLLLEALAPRSLSAPIQLSNIPPPFFYFRRFFLELSYVRTAILPTRLMSTKAIYGFLQTNRPPNVIEGKHPNVNWRIVWRSVCAPYLATDIQSIWYLTVNGKQICNSRLHRIHLADTPLCVACDVMDTDEHRLVCGSAKDVWILVRQMLALITRTTPHVVLPHYLLFPDSVHFPQTKTNAVKWICGHAIHYLFADGEKNVLDFWNFLNERHCAVARNPKYRQFFSNFLGSVFLNPPQSWGVPVMSS